MSILQFECGGQIFHIHMPDHHRVHEWRNGVPPSDAITVHPRMFALFRGVVITGSVLIRISPFYYIKDGEFHVVEETTLNTTPYLATEVNKVRLAVVGFNLTTEAIEVYTGSEVVFSALTPPPLPTGLPDNFYPSFLVRLRYNTTELFETDITDARFALMESEGGGGSPTGAAGGVLGGTYPNPSFAADMATQAELDASAVTLAADIDAILGLTGQQLTLDTQTANRILAGPTSGGAADPTFRALVAADTGELSGGVWLLRTDGLRIKYATLPLANTDAATGDVIQLGPGTYSLTALETLADIGLTIEGESPQSTIITNSITNNAAFFINAANITFRNVTVRHTGAGTASGCFQVNANNFTLDNVIVEKTSGAPTTGYACWIYAGTGHRFTNGTKLTCTSGTTKYGVQNSLATVTLTVEGGSIQGDTFDIFGDQTGSTLTLNNVVLVNDLVSFSGLLLGTHLGVAAYRSTTLSVSTLTVTVVLLDSEVRDDSRFHDTSSNTGRLTVPTGMAGWYLITGNVRFAGDSSGSFRQILIDVNASGNYIAAQLSAPPGAAAFNMAMATLWYLAAGDYVQLYAHHNATGSLLLEVNTHSPSFRMVRVR